MKVLAIETSCDETGIAVVEATRTQEGFVFNVQETALLSQIDIHAPYGGVFPNLAKREHEKNLPVLFEKFKDGQYDAVAVTHGPGLEPALWTGINFAQAFAKEKNVPLIPTNHMEGHLISSLAQPATEHSDILKNVRMFRLENVKLPVLALLISGGHTEFVVMREWLGYELLGTTVDDAVGEAFDKVARMLGLPYPGGPALSKLAANARTTGAVSPAALPRPMLGTNNCDVSFSGLKTAALYALRDLGGAQALSAQQRAGFAAEFENAVTEVFVAKTRRALLESSAKTFVIGGGVAANSYIREALKNLIAEEFPDVEFRIPELSITGDNAIMIAEAAAVRLLLNKATVADDNLRAVGNLSLAS